MVELPGLLWILGTFVGVPLGWVGIYRLAVWTNRHNDHQRALNEIKEQQAADMANEALRVARIQNDRMIKQMGAPPDHPLELTTPPLPSDLITRIEDAAEHPERRVERPGRSR